MFGAVRSITLLVPVQRRKPKQERAGLRRESLLKAAGELFNEVGFGEARMAAIAKRANASVGALYDYFPNKMSLALVLAEQYARESEIHFSTLLTDRPYATPEELAGIFMEGTIAFVAKRPSYPKLLLPPVHFGRSEAARRPLRRTFANALRKLEPTLAADRALVHAHVIIEILKASLSVRDSVPAGERDKVAETFTVVLAYQLRQLH